MSLIFINFCDNERGFLSIKEGRRIYDNIKKSILFLLPTSFAEGLVVAFSILTGQQVPLQPAQLLWINLISAITIQFAFFKAGASFTPSPVIAVTFFCSCKAVIISSLF